MGILWMNWIFFQSVWADAVHHQVGMKSWLNFLNSQTFLALFGKSWRTDETSGTQKEQTS